MDAKGPPIPALKAGLTARCPRCGEGALFRGPLDLRERCDKCGLDYKFIDTGDGPAIFGIMILGFLVLGVILGPLALIFGGVGLSRANNGASGKGMAIAGIVLVIIITFWYVAVQRLWLMSVPGMTGWRALAWSLALYLVTTGLVVAANTLVE